MATSAEWISLSLPWPRLLPDSCPLINKWPKAIPVISVATRCPPAPPSGSLSELELVPVSFHPRVSRGLGSMIYTRHLEKGSLDFSNLGLRTVRCQQHLHFTAQLLTIQDCPMPKTRAWLTSCLACRDPSEQQPACPTQIPAGTRVFICSYSLSPMVWILPECGKVHVHIFLLPKVIKALPLAYFIEAEKKFNRRYHVICSAVMCLILGERSELKSLL